MSNRDYKLVVLKWIRGNREIKELRTTVNHSRLLSLQLPTLPCTFTLRRASWFVGPKSLHVDDPRRHLEEPKCPWHMTRIFISSTRVIVSFVMLNTFRHQCCKYVVEVCVEVSSLGEVHPPFIDISYIS